MEGTSKIEDKKQFAVTMNQNQLATDDESRRNHNKQSTIEGPSQIEDKTQADQDERKKNDEKDLALQGKGERNMDKQKQSVVEVEREINPNKHLTTKNQSKIEVNKPLAVQDERQREIEKQNQSVDNNESKRKGKRQSEVENATSVESFIGKMEKQKLFRFSREQLRGFTGNYSSMLGSGGYGIVYKGEAPDGTMLAVKVLKDVSRKTFREKEFMAEVGTIGRTYHKNVVKTLRVLLRIRDYSTCI
ncbi:hypothetical protein NE237_001469 [Protea cynaroides]|uniref:Protein kinase domain-containing protein n=1 Tax=Protea cynaroides TaxID=273540 RepID=A0A9Q0QY46_9MAGN|nr:hypothetical protein NE237_001469 [Protea cynaroides]